MTAQTETLESKKNTSKKKKAESVAIESAVAAESAVSSTEAKKKAVSKKEATPKTKAEAVAASAAIDPTLVQEHVAHTAYLIAASEGFPEGRSLEHWVQAEERVNSLIAEGKLRRA